MRNFFKNFLLLLVSTTISLFIAEFIVRLIFRDSMVLFPRYHSDAEYGSFRIRTNRHNSTYVHTSRDGQWRFTINSQGFRNEKDFLIPKPDSIFRIISIGDSHTLGYEVEQNETFSAQLSSLLIQNGINAEVINSGVSGFSNAEEFVLLSNEGVRYKPDVVILGFCRNDYDDNVRSGIYSLEKDSLVLKSYTYLPGVSIQKFIYSFWIFQYLSENSYLYSYVFNSIWQFYKRLSIDNANRFVQEYAAGYNNSIDNYKINLSQKILKKIYDFCNLNNILLIVIDIPYWINDNQIVPSLIENMKTNETKFYDYLITSEEIIRNVGMTNVLRKHGHHHMSPESHFYIANRCKELILRYIYETKCKANPN